MAHSDTGEGRHTLPNANAGVEVGISVDSNPSVGNAVLSAAQAADLLAGLW